MIYGSFSLLKSRLTSGSARTPAKLNKSGAASMTDASAFVPQERRDAIAQMTPLRRIGVPEDIAGAVLLLASEQARFITGAYLPVNGGIFMP